ncbi:carbohydrate-binding module family 13 protein [Xylaria arbuscula]|nr:carbohydrate-binding module family 13 protein [Xylaria arbuscula]
MSHIDILDGAIVSFLNYGNGVALDLYGGSAANGTPLVAWGFHEGQNQQWKLEKVDNSTVWPTWKLRNVRTNTYIDIENGNPANGTKIQAWEKSDNNRNQLFRLVTADPQGRVFMIQNVGTGTYIDAGNAENGAHIVGFAGRPQDINTHQLWRVLRVN